MVFQALGYLYFFLSFFDKFLDLLENIFGQFFSIFSTQLQDWSFNVAQVLDEPESKVGAFIVKNHFYGYLWNGDLNSGQIQVLGSIIAN